MKNVVLLLLVLVLCMLAGPRTQGDDAKPAKDAPAVKPVAKEEPKKDSKRKDEKEKEVKEPQKNLPTSRTDVKLEGWTVRVDDRLFTPANEELRKKALRFLEAKLFEITIVVPAEHLEKLRAVKIVLDLTHGKLGPMQYHPSASWLKDNGFSPDLAKCVHLPRAIDVVTSRNIREQPWVFLHELAHAYHDQVLDFDNPKVKTVWENFKKNGRAEKALLYNGNRVKHYGLTNQMEFFAEMTEAWFGSNDFFPFNRGELKESEPEIYELMKEIWSPAKK